MKLLIQSISENPFFVEVEEEATIMMVKTAIYQKKKIFPIHQTLIYQGKILSNQSTLQSIGVHLKNIPSLYYVISKQYRDRYKTPQTQKSQTKNKTTAKSSSCSTFAATFATPNPIPKPGFAQTKSNSLFGNGPVFEFNEGADRHPAFEFDEGIDHHPVLNSILDQLAEKSPQYSHAFKDKQEVYETYKLYSNPNNKLELAKSTDRLMNLLESKGVFYELARSQKALHEALNEVISKYKESLNPEWYAKMNKTNIPEKPLDGPSETPIEMNFFENNFYVNLLQYQLNTRLAQYGISPDVKPKNNSNVGLQLLQLMCLLQPKPGRINKAHFFRTSNQEMEINHGNLRRSFSFDEEDELCSISFDSSDNELTEPFDMENPFVINSDDDGFEYKEDDSVVSLSPRRQVKNSPKQPKYQQVFHSQKHNGAQKLLFGSSKPKKTDDDCFFDDDFVEANTKLLEQNKQESDGNKDWKLMCNLTPNKAGITSSISEDYSDEDSDVSDVSID